jgi:hypothetical protein
MFVELAPTIAPTPFTFAISSIIPNLGIHLSFCLCTLLKPHFQPSQLRFVHYSAAIPEVVRSPNCSNEESSKSRGRTRDFIGTFYVLENWMNLTMYGLGELDDAVVQASWKAESISCLPHCHTLSASSIFSSELLDVVL